MWSTAADAAEAATLINDVFKPPAAGSSNSRDPRQFFRRMRDGGGDGDNNSSSAPSNSTALQAQSHVLAVADERTNAVIVSAPDELIPQIETFVGNMVRREFEITENNEIAVGTGTNGQMRGITTYTSGTSRGEIEIKGHRPRATYLLEGHA